MKVLYAISALLFSHLIFSQNSTIFGVVSDLNANQPIELAIVHINETDQSIETNIAGEYSIKVPSNSAFTIIFSRVGFKQASLKVESVGANIQKRVDVQLVSSTSTKEVVIKDSRITNMGMIREDIKDFKLLPTTTGNIESLLPNIALGTNSGSGGELSSQYQVRGGNYDENLVYVNDFEIYRPQLVRQGQQEGLTFANPDLVRDLSFSSGGFEAKYGDKLSSVLDIKYKRPDALRASIAGSFLGGSAHVEGSFKAGKDSYRKFRYLIGTRYKTTQFLLSSLETKGEYVPSFYDIQTYMTYDISKNMQIGLLANYNKSNYDFVPTSRTSATGVVNFTVGLRTFFEGKEQDDFNTGMGGISLSYAPDRNKNPYFLKLLASTNRSLERERFDIIGNYIIGEIETNPGSKNAGEIVSVLGEGVQQTYIRNTLYAQTTNIEHKGGIEFQKKSEDPFLTRSHLLQWSLKYQNANISDKINEWERIDSALYSLNFDTTALNVKSVYKSKNNLISNRWSGSLQDSYTWNRENVASLQITAGIRSSFWSLNNELTITPRVQINYKPLNIDKDISLRLSGGLYYQPPFYRELRNIQGVVNPKVMAQKSAHVVAGMTYDFFMGSRRRIPFKLIMEAYYKKLWDLVSYDVDNVRIRYAGDNNATGYATGLDIRLNGEFVPGAESWINLSFLRTRESIDNVQHLQREYGFPNAVPVDDVARPSDRFFNLSMFFQDYLPKNKNFKVHTQLTVGSGLPYGTPENNIVYRNTYRLATYHRVDLGFSLQLWNRSWQERKPSHFLRFTRESWLSLEVFNLMESPNVASYTWIKTIYNTSYAIPNRLTSRRINLRFRADF
jgi:hypothetical protein